MKRTLANGVRCGTVAVIAFRSPKTGGCGPAGKLLCSAIAIEADASLLGSMKI